MNRINPPAVTGLQSFTHCANSIVQPLARQRMLDSSVEIEAAAVAYQYHAFLGTLFSIPPLLAARGDDPVVCGTLLKSELINLYDYSMVQRHPGRDYYDRILTAANEKCPYCGGIGRPQSLDHYLPKAHYPQYSVNPQNLIPSCRDCNTGKSNGLAQDAAGQPIHPYLDSDRFFLEQWVSAEVVYTDPCYIRFFTSVPQAWPQVDASRAINHFSDFDLGKRYAIQAGEELGVLIDQRRGFLANLSPQEFAQFLNSVASARLFPNHWKKVMYQALSTDHRFCSTVF